MLIATIQNLENLAVFKKSGGDGVLVALEPFSIRNESVIEKEQLIEWKDQCRALDLRLFVNMMRMIHEEDLDALAHFLRYLKEIDIDGIYYADEGVYELAREIGIEDRLIYQPETLVTSWADVQFYKQLGIQSICLAHELSLEEIEEIAQKEQDIEILIDGYFSILYSRRHLIKNYMHHLEKKTDQKRFDLIENTREERLPVLEEESGTFVFSARPIQSYNQIQDLQKAGVHRFRIDSIFSTDAETIEKVQIYKKLLDGERIEANLESQIGSDRWYHEQTVRKKGDKACKK